MTKRLIIEVPDDFPIGSAIEIMHDLSIFCNQNIGMKWYWEDSIVKKEKCDLKDDKK